MRTLNILLLTDTGPGLLNFVAVPFFFLGAEEGIFDSVRGFVLDVVGVE